MTTETNSTPDGLRVMLSEAFELPLTRRAAFRLFTARGEELWVPGWEPRFPVPAADDLDVGTVWQTLDAKLDSGGSLGISRHWPSRANFQPWYTHRMPPSSLRPK